MRFLHTADWQLGMTRHFLSPEAQARFSDARLAAVRAIGDLAAEQHCDFVVVCGDVFEANQLHPQVVGRALEAMASIPVPVYLLPGNHDTIDAGSVYRSAAFKHRCPDHVHVLAEPGVHEIAPGIELVAAPLNVKHPLTDLPGDQCRALVPNPGVQRILVGHGAVDTLSPDPGNPATIRTGTLSDALADGRIHYVALGDRHSTTQVAGRAIWYSGAPEVTDFIETDPGNVLVVDLDRDLEARVTHHRVGTWSFIAAERHLNRAADVEEFDRWLHDLPNKDRTVLKLGLVGSISVADKARLDEITDTHSDVFAALNVSSRRSDLAVLPDDHDFTDLGLSGFVAAAAQELVGAAAGDPAAQDALSLLYRLARSAA
ncbi:DNA repair exonuclease SbcCD nuclease subunit [Amycolatopsis echigonensis]|uniref:Nuclease SbcCD subunit D n=1 Tax=Amycolatopsis echigonensis TaxID=2576905 RepID=A0A2N3WSQ7_9PSEU|nr:exonuclease SbcCD subunit D [Amycolatopsis niigatensis]PKV96919.1 DNA repair exonuclease SbcCD nuclease subunit [Amycolatopsis niigatensis]